MTRRILAFSFAVVSLLIIVLAMVGSSRTEAGEPGAFTQGNVNCDGEVGAQDSLAIMNYAAGVSNVTSAGGCPVIGISMVGGYAWGDLNCDGNITGDDAIPPLKYKAGLPVDHFANCVDAGQPLGGPTITPSPSPTPDPCTLAGWTAAKGAAPWVCTSATSITVHATDGDNILLRNEGFTDIHFEANVSTTDREVSLFFRAQDANNGYVATLLPSGLPWRSFGPGAIYLYKVVGGVYTEITHTDFTGAPTVGQAGYLVVDAIGSQIQARLNGDLKIDTTDNTYGGGKVGLRVYGDNSIPCDSVYDNIFFQPAT
jgi:hypothetical protein